MADGRRRAYRSDVELETRDWRPAGERPVSATPKAMEDVLQKVLDGSVADDERAVDLLMEWELYVRQLAKSPPRLFFAEVDYPECRAAAATLVEWMVLHERTNEARRKVPTPMPWKPRRAWSRPRSLASDTTGSEEEEDDEGEHGHEGAHEGVPVAGDAVVLDAEHTSKGRLPDGWRVQETTRKSGTQAGKKDRVWIAPDNNKRFRSLRAAEKWEQQQQEQQQQCAADLDAKVDSDSDRVPSRHESRTDVTADGDSDDEGEGEGWSAAFGAETASGAGSEFYNSSLIKPVPYQQLAARGGSPDADRLCAAHEAEARGVKGLIRYGSGKEGEYYATGTIVDGGAFIATSGEKFAYTECLVHDFVHEPLPEDIPADRVDVPRPFRTGTCTVSHWGEESEARVPVRAVCLGDGICPVLCQCLRLRIEVNKIVRYEVRVDANNAVARRYPKMTETGVLEQRGDFVASVLDDKFAEELGREPYSLCFITVPCDETT